MSKTISEERKVIRPPPPVAFSLPLTIQFRPRLDSAETIFTRLDPEGLFELIAQLERNLFYFAMLSGMRIVCAARPFKPFLICPCSLYNSRLTYQKN